MKYDYKIDMDTDSSHSLVLKRINPNSTVLEFGPSNGYMTKYMKEELGCIVYCIEADEEAAKIAKTYCKKMIVDDIDNLSWRHSLPINFFDYIIFADVLEHLKRPREALETAVGFLKKNGAVITSIPNIAHNAVIMELLQGKFDYRQVGLLDETHLRFFTKKSIRELLRNAGLRSIEWFLTTSRPEHTEFQQYYSFFPVAVQSYMKSRDDGNVYQFITVSKKVTDVKPEEIHDEPDINNENIFQDSYLQAFWESKNEFSESCSVKATLRYDKGFITHKLILPSEAKGIIRLDPGSEQSYIEIKDLMMQFYKKLPETREITRNVDGADENIVGSIKPDILPGAGIISLGDNNLFRFVCINNDPQLFLSVIPEEFSSCYKVLSLKMYATRNIPDSFLGEISQLINQLLIEGKGKQFVIEDKERYISQQQSEINSLKEKLLVQEEILTKNALRLKNAKIALTNRDQKVEALTQTLLKQQTELDIFRNRLAQVLDSYSWRFTAPFRCIAKTLQPFILPKKH